MSAKVNAFARWRTISTSQVPQTPKAVLLALALHADKDWTARPSVATIAQCSSITRRTAQRALRWLEERALLTVVGRHKTPNGAVALYRLQVSEITTWGASQSHGRHRVTRVTESPQGRHSVAGGASQSHPRGVTVTPEPSIEPASGPSHEPSSPPKAPQGAKRKRVKPEPWKASEALTLLADDISTAWEEAPGADPIAWGVDGPQARRSRMETLGWWLGELPVKRQPKAVYTPDRIRAAWAVFLAEDWARDPGRGITTFLRATQLPKWTEAGGTPQDTAPQTAPPPEPDLSGLSVGELVDLESNHANIQALRRRRKQESV